MKQESFSEDFERMMAEIRRFCAIQDLPAPTIVAHPEWRSAMRQSFNNNDSLSPKFEFMGVPMRFGQFESNVAVFREQ